MLKHILKMKKNSKSFSKIKEQNIKKLSSTLTLKDIENESGSLAYNLTVVKEDKKLINISGFQILSKLGVGATVEAYKIYWDFGPNPVAGLKFQFQNTIQSGIDSDVTQAFIEEFKLGLEFGGNKSKVFPKIHRLLYDDSCQALWIIMECFHGSLEDKIKSCGLGWEKSLLYLAAPLRAISIFHNLGFVHCDIKPSNILYKNRSNRVVLSDFGLLTPFQFMKNKEIISPLGTPEYMYTEAFKRNPSIDTIFNMDIYSWFVTWLKISTGALPPFSSKEEILNGSYKIKIFELMPQPVKEFLFFILSGKNNVEYFKKTQEVAKFIIKNYSIFINNQVVHRHLNAILDSDSKKGGKSGSR